MKKELTPRKKQALEMRSRIQNVALELFDKEGFENVSVEQIAQAVGCSVGNIYHYFKSKDELVIQVTSSVDAQYSVLEASYLADEANSWHDKLLDFVGQTLVISAEDPSLYRSFIHGIRYPQQGILRDNEKRVYFRVLRELVDGCKQEGTIAGIEIAQLVLQRLDPEMKFEQILHDGDRVAPGDVAFYVSGRLRSLLQAERILLNIMQRMSGVATQTAVYADKIKDLHTKVLDTRKTTPGMRVLDKMAVKIGGGENHRMGLFDMILLKDNHIDFAGGIRPAIEGAKAYLKAKGKNIPIECEVRSLEDIDEVFAAGGVDRIMFDNFTPELTRQAVAKVAGRCETESSGGITLDTLREYAETGVDFISVGALTHQIKSLDMSLKAC